MARIGLTSGFSVVPEGTHIFCITGVEYKESFGKLNLTLTNQDGQKHIERYSLLKPNGETNDGAINAFSYFAHTAMQDFDLQDINPEDLIGHFVECTVEHQEVPSKNDPKKMLKFAHITDTEESDGWGEAEEPASEPTQEPAEEAYDLASLLGN